MIYVRWFIKPRPGNFGDLLTPIILKHFDVDFEFSSSGFDAICVGSIASIAGYKTIVLGSGIISLNDKLDPEADWRFVRGPYTRRQVLYHGGKCPKIYGDPGLLLPLMCERSEIEYPVGIVPHFADYQYAKEKYPDAHIINVLNQDPISVVKEITKCEKIISSSLHGLITAHAYGIPAAWVHFNGPITIKNKSYDDIKFIDYYSSAGDYLPIKSTVEKPHYTDLKIDLDPIIEIFVKLAIRSKRNNYGNT